MNEIKTNSRFNNLNAIKFMAALFVLTGHMYVLLGQAPVRMYQIALQTIGIQIFFIVGGYLTYMSFKRDPNIVRYSLRRVLRILPPLIVMVGLVVFVMGPIFTTFDLKSYFLNRQTWMYFRNIFLNIQFALPGVFADNIYPHIINGSLWSLTVEVAFYLLLPFVAWFIHLFKKHQYKILAILIGMFWLGKIIHNIYYPNSVFIFYNQNFYDALQLIPYFLLGMLFTSEKLKKCLNFTISSIIIILLLFVQLPYPVLDLCYSVALPYFVFSFAFMPNPRFAKLFKKTDFAYGLYLYGFVVQQILIQLFKDSQTNFYFYLSLTFLFAGILAYLSWRFVELKSEKWVSKFLASPKLKAPIIEKFTMKSKE